MSHNSDYSRLYIGDGYGLSIDEVGICLGSSSKDLGTLCRHPAINMLSWYKPTAYPGFESGTRDQVFYYDSTRPEASFDNDACSIHKLTKSISYSVYSTTDAGTVKFVSDIGLFDNQFKWTYIRPPYPGGRYRLRDFNGYVRRGATTYPKTGTGLPYETSLFVGESTSTSGTLVARMTLRFSSGDTASLLGLQQLLAEGNTSPLTLDLRLGFALRTKNREDSQVCLMYISDKNLRDYMENGVFTESTTKSGLIVNTPEPDSTHIRNVETVQAYPFIAKKKDNNWLLYGFGIDSYPTVEQALNAASVDLGLHHGNITLTLDKMQDGTFVFYVAQASHFELQIEPTSSSSTVLFGTNPVAIGASLPSNPNGGYLVTRKPGVITLGSQDLNSGYWVFNESAATSLGYIYGTSINGWNTTDTPFSRAGSFAVQPMDNLSSFNLQVFVNTNYGPRSASTTVNVATAQTGDTFALTLALDDTNPQQPE